MYDPARIWACSKNTAAANSSTDYASLQSRQRVSVDGKTTLSPPSLLDYGCGKLFAGIVVGLLMAVQPPRCRVAPRLWYLFCVEM